MKKILLSICTVLTLGATAQLGNIPNGGLENWTTDTTGESPMDWVTTEDERPGTGAVLRSSDATDGQASIQLQTLQVGTDTVFGYAVLGGIGQNGPDQHIAYSDQIDSLTFWMKYDMAGDDSVTVFVSRVQGNNPPVLDFFLLGGTQNAWTRFAFELIPMTQDSILIGFASSNAFVSQGVPGSNLYLDDVRFTSGSGTPSLVPNYSFENWNYNIIEEPDDLYTLNAWLAGTGQVSVAKTTDAQTGSYAATVETIQIGNDTVPGFLLNAPLVPGQQPGFVPYTAQPTTFSGAYKYSPANGDQGTIVCNFYDNGSLVASPTVPLTGNVATYTTFSIPVGLSAAPDSMQLVVYSGNNPGTVVWVDDLALTGGNVGYQDLLGLSGIKLYPNPAVEQAILELNVNSNSQANIQVVDLNGRKVANITRQLYKGENQVRIDVTDFAPGIYIVEARIGDNVTTTQLVVK